MADDDMGATGAPEVVGETSRQGLRRMRRLALEGVTPTTSQNVIIHPSTGYLVYPAPSPHIGHLVSSLFPGAQSRLLPAPPASKITHSHDGRYLVLFHPTGEGGTIAIYPQSILSPYASLKNTSSTSTLFLPRAPLDIIHLFPPRMYTLSGLAAQAGPLPPAGYEGSHGPAFIVLMPDGLLLIHPQKNLTGDGWSMNVLKAPLHTRAQTRVGDPVPVTMGPSASKGWMGIVKGSDAVWVGLEVEGRVSVVRVEVGVEDTGRWFIRTTPMPRFVLPPTAGNDREDYDLERSTQKIVFSPSTVIEQPKEGEDEKKESREGVSVTVVSSERTGSGSARTRIDSIPFERRLVTLADGFAEISSLSDVTPSWDWELVSSGILSSISPNGVFVVDLVTLPSLNSAAAVLETSEGSELCRLNLHTAGDSNSGPWSAIEGKTMPLTGIRGVSGLVATQGVLRGCVGLVCVLTPQRTILVPWPDNLEDSEKSMASSVVLAIKQNMDWSDVVRASKANVKKLQREERAKVILREAFALLKEDPELDSLLEASRLQVALLGTNDHAKRDLASEILQLQEASLLFSSMAIVKDGKVTFELDTVWPLLFTSEYVFSVLANALREIVMERAILEWEGEEHEKSSLRVLYAVNPQIRGIVCRLLAQIQAFIAFVGSVNRPILPPQTRPLNALLPMRDIRATALAKDRVKGMAMKQGVDVIKWGKALYNLQKESQATEADLESFLFLEVPQTRAELSKALEQLPNPSSLFMMDELEPEVFDRVTFVPLAQNTGVRCERCAGRTVVNVPGAFSTLGDGIWERWKEERGKACGCGGNWAR